MRKDHDFSKILFASYFVPSSFKASISEKISNLILVLSLLYFSFKQDAQEGVDSCYPQSTQALNAHRGAFKQIRETVHDLLSQYLLALDDALEIL